MSEPFCDDCPDREGCQQGYPCDYVKQIHRLTPDEIQLAHKLTDAGPELAEAVESIFEIVEAAFGRGYNEALTDTLHPEFGSVWDRPDGTAWKAFKDGERQGWDIGHRLGWQSGIANEPFKQRLHRRPEGYAG